jgi:dTDP-glucose 4,6-dehydratase
MTPMSGAAAVPEWTFEQDLAEILRQTGSVWPALRGGHLFITGGTGSIGRWLLESLCYADRSLELGIEATILTRDYPGFQRQAPHLARYPAFQFVTGDIADFATPKGAISHIIHAAADASAHLNEHEPRRMFDALVMGTRRILDVAVEKRVARVLFLSSGAVYGRQPWTVERIAEDWSGGPDCLDPRNAYAEGKRAAEMLCAIYGKQWGGNVSIARIFALLGPLLPLTAHFAAGNFILDAMQGRPVMVNGDGRPCRSYLYLSDLTISLWHMLMRAEPGRAYNVGSDETISIRALAERIARLLGSGECRIRGAPDSGWNPGRYVPDTGLLARDLGLVRTVSLDDAIIRTALWNGWKGQGAP